MNKRVLYIEDEKFLLEQIQIALEEYFEIIPASSAVKGLELVNKMDFDVVLLYIMMPPPDDIDAEIVGYGRTTGVEVCRRIKNMKPYLPIVILSVVRDPGILSRIKEAGANEILYKPALPNKITEALNKVLDIGSSQTKVP